jgi:hypothetical protein
VTQQRYLGICEHRMTLGSPATTVTRFYPVVADPPLSSFIDGTATPEQHRHAYSNFEEYRELLGLEPPEVEGGYFRCGGCHRQLLPENLCFCQNPHPTWRLDAAFYGMTYSTLDGRRIDPATVEPFWPVQEP